MVTFPGFLALLCAPVYIAVVVVVPSSSSSSSSSSSNHGNDNLAFSLLHFHKASQSNNIESLRENWTCPKNDYTIQSLDNYGDNVSIM